MNICHEWARRDDFSPQGFGQLLFNEKQMIRPFYV